MTTRKFLNLTRRKDVPEEKPELVAPARALGVETIRQARNEESLEVTIWDTMYDRLPDLTAARNQVRASAYPSERRRGAMIVTRKYCKVYGKIEHGTLFTFVPSLRIAGGTSPAIVREHAIVGFRQRSDEGWSGLVYPVSSAHHQLGLVGPATTIHFYCGTHENVLTKFANAIDRVACTPDYDTPLFHTMRVFDETRKNMADVPLIVTPPARS